jgi:hypothetical protein
MRKLIYSFSTTLESVVGNTRLARDGVGEEISRLKEQPRKDIAVWAPQQEGRRECRARAARSVPQDSSPTGSVACLPSST